MSLYSLDSLEPVECVSGLAYSPLILLLYYRRKRLIFHLKIFFAEIEKSCIDYEAEDDDGDGRRTSEELSLAVSSSSSRKIAESLAPIGKSLSRSSELLPDKKLKNDKKLSGVLPPVVIEAKAKPKTYLELYRERAGK